MPRVELHSQANGLVGEVELRDGVARPSNDAAEATMLDTKIVAPGPRVLKPEDGEEYLRAMPLALNGTYFWAELVE